MRLSLYSLVIDPLLSGLRRAVAESAGLAPGGRILDVCCGTGAQAIYYARTGLVAEGIDLDPVMIALAKDFAARADINFSNFRVADATDLPFAAGEFDAASISLALHEKPFQQQMVVISEMQRVVRPGGRLILADFQVPLPDHIAGWFVQRLEKMVGGQHYQCFQQYRQRGGLDSIIEWGDIEGARISYCLGGAVKIVNLIATENIRLIHACPSVALHY